MTPTQLTAHLGDWSTGEGTLHVRLAESLRRAILTGGLQPGARLPAERILARSLAVSRSTVVAALDQLRQDGLIISRHGSGTYVPPDLHRKHRPDKTAPMRRNVVTQAFVEGSSGAIELLSAHVDGAPILGMAPFERALPDLAPWLAGAGYWPLGIPPLREAVAELLTERGIPTAADEVLITNGAQQAICLCASVFLQRGDVALTESPTYLTAIDVFASAGARLVGVPVDQNGVRIGALREALERHAPALAYLMPTFQNPTGVSLSERARQEVAALCDAHPNTVFVEDDALADLSFGGEAPTPPLARYVRNGTCILVGSMSKVYWAGLRVGWLRASRDLVRRIGRLKAVSDIGGAVPSQVFAVHLLEEHAEYRAARCRQVKVSYDALVEQLASHLPSWTYHPPLGGLALWVRLPCGDAGEFAQVAQRHGVSIVPGHLAAPEGGHTDYLRLPLTLAPETLREGVRRLEVAWKSYAPAADRRRAALEVWV